MVAYGAQYRKEKFVALERKKDVVAGGEGAVAANAGRSAVAAEEEEVFVATGVTKGEEGAFAAAKELLLVLSLEAQLLLREKEEIAIMEAATDDNS